MKLYEIASDYTKILEEFMARDDMTAADVADTMQDVQDAFGTKAVNIVAFARGLEAEAKAIKEAEEAMAKRRRAIETRSAWLLEYVKSGMEAVGTQKIKHPWFSVSIQNNPASLVIENESALSPEFVSTRVVEHTIVDKAAIKEALKQGKEVSGCRLSVGTRLVVR